MYTYLILLLLDRAKPEHAINDFTVQIQEYAIMEDLLYVLSVCISLDMCD